MNIFRHEIPIPEGATLDDFPKSDDPRMKPFIETLIKHGVMSPEGNTLRPCTLRRGANTTHFLIEVELKAAHA